MSNKIIRSALESQLKTWANAQSPAIPIAFQNVTFTLPTQARYLRAFLLPADTKNPSLGGDHRRLMGIFQVSICVPEGGGASAAETIESALIDLFACGTSVVKSGITVRILKTPSAKPASNEPGLYVVPLSIEYSADVFA